ncbi:MAG: PEP-CTERM sorting domain-containing protein [Verrucomicrobiota bacterium]
MDVSKVILYDSVTDNLYAYNREDRFAANNGSLLLWTFGDFDNSGDLDNTFTNGPLANQNISNQISNLIAVDNNLYFIDGDNTVHAYDQDLDFVETSTITLSGDLAGETLSDLVDGLVDGYTYLGWDLGGIGVLGISDPRVVPEPSSYALLIGIVSFSLSYFRRRRRQ